MTLLGLQIVYAVRLATVAAAREAAQWGLMAEQAGEAIETRQRWLSGHLYRRTA